MQRIRQRIQKLEGCWSHEMEGTSVPESPPKDGYGRRLLWAATRSGNQLPRVEQQRRGGGLTQDSTPTGWRRSVKRKLCLESEAPRAGKALGCHRGKAPAQGCDPFTPSPPPALPTRSAPPPCWGSHSPDAPSPVFGLPWMQEALVPSLGALPWPPQSQLASPYTQWQVDSRSSGVTSYLFSHPVRAGASGPPGPLQAKPSVHPAHPPLPAHLYHAQCTDDARHSSTTSSIGTGGNRPGDTPPRHPRHSLPFVSFPPHHHLGRLIIFLKKQLRFPIRPRTRIRKWHHGAQLQGCHTRKPRKPLARAEQPGAQGAANRAPG